MVINTAHRYRRTLSASSLAGDHVVNNAGEDLGKIEDIMIDLETGKVAYAVLSFGSVLGLGGKYFAIPFRALTIDEDNKRLVLNIEKSRLERAPGFDKNDWPDMSSPSFSEQVHSYYGVNQYET